MECVAGKWKKKHGKHIHLVNDIFSESSLSSDSETFFHPFKCLSKKKKKRTNYSKREYFIKHFEKKKLKEKSLSKKMKTPFDRKLNRSCWPIEMKKLSKIKKKPHEKRKEKPTNRSLPGKNFTDSTFVKFISNNTDRIINGPQVTVNPFDCLEDDSFENVCHCLKKRHYLYDQVSPQMLMSVLQDPEFMDTGVTIDMIIERLWNLKPDLNASLEQLKEEIAHKLHCAIQLGLVVENNGYYRIVRDIQHNKSSKKKGISKQKPGCSCHCQSGTSDLSSPTPVGVQK